VFYEYLSGGFLYRLLFRSPAPVVSLTLSADRQVVRPERYSTGYVPKPTTGIKKLTTPSASLRLRGEYDKREFFMSTGAAQRFA